jgi:glycosyltransferase involved in cell wall biosynthesis
MDTVNVSLVIPSLGRENLKKLLVELEQQDFDGQYEVVIVYQDAELNEVFKSIEKRKEVSLHYAERSKGWAHWRNVGARKAKGEILVFIDDDELPYDTQWLKLLTQPILSGNELVTTSGIKVDLKYGLLGNTISLMGFPGGGAIGFKRMWPVDDEGYTDHLCSGNFAITKAFLEELGGFAENLKYGSEDVVLAMQIVLKDTKILYIDDADLFNSPITKFSTYWMWAIIRGKSVKNILQWGKTLKKKPETDQDPEKSSRMTELVIKRMKSLFSSLDYCTEQKLYVYYIPVFLLFILHNTLGLFGYFLGSTKSDTFRLE